MPANYQNIQKRLQAFDFTGLFTQELMWNHYSVRDLLLTVDGVMYTLKPVAERGMAVFECAPPADAQFPRYATRRKIDTQVSKTAREHIIIFHDNANTVQVWQWVKREAGKPSACREQLFYRAQSGDALTQKIQGIAFELEDEPTVMEALSRVGAAFDVEKVTKKFYDQFKTEHDAFLKFTKGIRDEKLQRWYASVMLNRLMFIYFIQKKGFLAGDQHYLTKKLEESKRRGSDKFYGDLLCPLFFEGFAKREEQRSAETNRMLGRVPYLNGGLFLKHQIEELHGRDIEVPDKAFERIFDFFEQYDWHLDDRPTRTGREVNPDVLGYVFEKYINQKEMGAYYTKEDITGYISQSTIIPAILDMARKSCRIAFEGEHSTWRLLQADPDRYIYAAMLKGMDKELPESIAAGLNDVNKRGDWNKPAGPEYALPTETWREAVERRTRCQDIRAKLRRGEVRSINDLITYNLDIRRFAEEVIANCEGPDLLRAFYKAIRTVSVLDPACGSGAFLFAALNILEQLYDTCLVRMQAFVDDLDRSGEKHRPEKFKDFRETLEEMNDKSRHPSPRYFILKSIILKNLYGVDIMEEATEICKLRLFLKLVAQVNPGEKIEPLPDIDFNIRAGNTLVGFASRDEVKHAIGSKLDFDNRLQAIEDQAELVEKAFCRFRQIQMDFGVEPAEFADAKNELRGRLDKLRHELDAYLAGEYAIKPSEKSKFAAWRASHQPFHWIVEFFGIMRDGGFDALIGNPPYVEYSKVKSQYQVRGLRTLSCNNLYSFFVERSLQLISTAGRFGMIVPLSLVCTQRMQETRGEFRGRDTWISSFDIRPSGLFEEVTQRLCIALATDSAVDGTMRTAGYRRWLSEERPALMSTLAFVELPNGQLHNKIPKLAADIEASILRKIDGPPLSSLARKMGNPFYLHRIVRYFVKAVTFIPLFVDANGRRSKSEDYKSFRFEASEQHLIAALLNTSLFYWYWRLLSDGFHCGYNDVYITPFRVPTDSTIRRRIEQLHGQLMEDLKEHSERKSIKTQAGIITYQEFYPKLSKSIADRIDRAFAQFYDLSECEIDFILNYDLKYRMGREASDEVERPSPAAY
jgi:hypothetical protein